MGTIFVRRVGRVSSSAEFMTLVAILAEAF